MFPSMSAKISILLLHEQALIRQGLGLILQKEKDLCLIAEADSPASALHLLHACKPALLLMDASKPDVGRAHFLRNIRKQHPQLAVLLLGVWPGYPGLERLLNSGIRGVLHPRVSREEFLDAIRGCARGQRRISAELSPYLMQSMIERSLSGKNLQFGQSLSPRESEVLHLITREMTTREIAEKLSLSPKTVENHRLRIMQKTGSRNLAGLTRFAIRSGLLPPSEI